MEDNNQYIIDEAKALSETIDGETIIINLQTGTYYSLNETATAIWNFLRAGCAVRQIISGLLAVFESTVEVVRPATVKFVQELESAGLILPGSKIVTEALPATPEVKKAFVLPQMEKYEDMQEMLLADPIHDVDTAGWPKRKEDK